MNGEDEALLILTSHVQRHARVRARAGKLQARQLQHSRAWKKQRAGSQGHHALKLTDPSSQPSSVQELCGHQSLGETQGLPVHSRKGC